MLSSDCKSGTKGLQAELHAVFMKATIFLALLTSSWAAFGADVPRVLTLTQTGSVVAVSNRIVRMDPAVLQPQRPSVLGLPSPQSYVSSSDLMSHDAEPINERAMRRYRQRWELHIRSPQTFPSPSLYPSRVELMFETTR
jgi:hypothetical protein